MDYGYNKLMKCFRRIVTVAILFGFFVRLSHGQTRPPPSEKVKVPICKSAYDTTSFSKPNIFNHTSQDEAILHMHTFQPLITTFCHHELIFFTCLVHIPWYHQESDTPGVLRSVCRSLCENIRTECQFAINKLNFHWPERISCEKFGNERNCVSKDPKRSPRPTGNQTCSAVLYNGGTPICSEIKTTEPPVGKYFVFVNNPFSNYFGHKTQEQALYELSRHAKLIHLLISQQPDINKTNEVTQCLNDITFLLCNLYLPKCGSKTPRDYPINSSQCRNVLGKNCNSAIQQLLNRGYNVTWPPVQVDCERFNTISTGAAPRFEKVRTFGGLSPPPPGVESKGISDNFLEIKWNSFPEEYKFGTTVETCILYKKSGSNVEYMHRHTNKNSHVLRGLNASTKYEIFVATVNSEALLPGVLEKIELQTVEGVEEIKLGYCSSLYNFTKLPNIFGHQTQDQAIRSIHKIGPLLNTACSSDLKALICSAYLPNYLPSEQAIQPPCKSLCERVTDKCKHAISQLRFKWPDELKCGNLKEQAPCYQPKPLPGPPDDKGCKSVDEPSICSIINKPNTTTSYFTTVSEPFRNYFNHTSQEQAAYELSKHAKLLSLLSTLIAVDHRNSLTHTQCVQRLAYFLCRLYFPKCNGGSEISQNDCKSIVETDRQKAGQLYRLVCLDSVERLQFQYRYNINWPPVRINCDSIDSSVVTPKVGYKDIRFQEILPPPADIVYQTIGQTVQLRKQRIRNIELTDPSNAVKILYKQKDTEMAYLHNNHTSLPATLNIDTSKDYEFLVANMEPKNGMPGYFDRIMYTAGASVNNLPSICPTHELIVLPNKFGDNLSNARSRMIPLFPLVRTLCNSCLQTFLCSAVFPRYYFGRQDPCRSTCKKIFEDCSYAIARTKFLWPDEFKCDKFPNENCFDVTTTSRSILNEDDDGLPPPPLNQRGARSVRECKPTTVEICSRIRGDGPVSPFQSTFVGGQINYFKHSSTAQATFELSRHLRLLSVLQEFARRRHRAATECLRYLPLFLCHVYVPSCPAKTQPQSLCTAVLGNGSVCFEAVKAFNQMDYDLKWPPVDVNCNDEKWFTPNGTLPSANFFPILPRPPPSNVEISRKTADEISVSFRSLDSSLVGLLYRQNNSETSYKSLEGGRDLLNIPKLSAAIEYEIKVATMDRNGFPGIFRTITSRTFESSVIEIPRSMDICYNYYRNTALPNMYGDKTIESAKLKFYPFYPLVDTFCSSELETFLCSIFLPRYDPESLVSQKPCREACDRVYKSCKFAIARSRFHWPHELECSKFSNDATCYNLTKDETQGKKELADEGERFLPPQRRRRAISSGCKETPSTPICSSIRRPAAKGGQLSGDEYFKTTVENGNYFNHRSTDEAVYEMSRYSNLLSSLAGSRLCFNQLTFLLCHLHLPACPQSPISQRNCLEFMSNKSSCFIPIKNLNDKGANFNWPPLKVNCQDRKWFSNSTLFDNFQHLGTNPFGPSAPVNIQINSRSSTKLGISFQRNGVFNATALYRRNGSSTAYQFITQHGTENPAKLSLDQLTPATDYEIKIASLRQTSDLPGPFVDIQSNTLGQCQNDTTGDDVAQGTFFFGDDTRCKHIASSTMSTRRTSKTRL
ncbi:uncharacterized protein LOC114533935 isoform X1 [Dendronephthya gigantea]|uniref:uncharacterized protein LOC114533935 isoform X1 n=1 Tax=Dendronephthya gigantea TaxID=151771 RepID=UPI001069AC2F|nr:uncharacterized protein LOC114533935 isoform X1 [Dendronephthya gigantea]